MVVVVVVCCHVVVFVVFVVINVVCCDVVKVFVMLLSCWHDAVKFESAGLNVSTELKSRRFKSNRSM